MKKRFGAGAITAVGLIAGLLLSPTAVSADPPTTIGTEDKNCVPGVQVDCTEITYKWKLEYHGDLSKADFSDSKLHGADLRGSKLIKTKFDRTVLKFAELQRAKLKKAKLKRSNLKHADLTEAKLSKAGLKRANLNYAKLQNTALTKADLRQANLNYARLTRANLDKADFGPLRESKSKKKNP